MLTKFTTDNCTVSYISELKSLHAVLSGFVPFEELQTVCEEEYKIIRTNEIKKCLIDLSKVKVYAKGAAEYINQVWHPTVKSIGVTHVAFVVPEDVFGRASMKTAHKDTEKEEGVEWTSENFKSETDAKEWLKGIN